MLWGSSKEAILFPNLERLPWTLIGEGTLIHLSIVNELYFLNDVMCLPSSHVDFNNDRSRLHTC